MADETEPGTETRDLDSLAYVKAALGWQYNVIGLAGAAAFAFVSGSGLPLLLATGLELIYLSLLPHNRRFQRLVRSWHYAREKQQRQQSLSAIFEELPTDMRQRFEQVSKLCGMIRENYGRLSSTSQMFVSQMEEKLDGLGQAYLRLLNSAHQHREYARQLDPEVIKREVALLTRKLESDSPKVQEINRGRIEILNKRLEKFGKIKENRQVIDAQCSAIEEVLALIRDQSVTMRDPQEVTDHLSTLVRDVEQTEETVRQVESVFDLAATETELPTDLKDATGGGARATSRQRMRR
jgi:hypothetical protein